MALDPALLALIKKGKAQYSKSSKLFAIKEGKTTLRVLAPVAGGKFWADTGVHWIKTEKNGKPVAVTGCHDIVHQTPCEICTAIDRASKTATDDETLGIIKEWKGKKKVLINALVRSGSDASEDPQIVELAPTAFGQILSSMEEYAAAEINILDPATGVDFIIERIGKNLDTEYRVMVAPKSKPVPAEALTKMHDLDAYIEKEHFRGEERKALTAIANMTGISITGPALAAPARTALLTGPAGSVDDAAVEEAVVESLEVAAPVLPKKVAPAATVAAKPAVVAKPAPAAKPAAAAPADDFGAALPQAEVDAMLAELDGVAA